MNTLHGEKHAQHFSHCQVSHPLLINNDDDDDDDNKQTLTVRKPVQMGKTPIMKKWGQTIGEDIEKISKSTDYRRLLISTGFQYSLTFNHQEIQLNSQIQIAHVKYAHAYTSVISINISLINRLHTFLPRWRLTTPSRNSNYFQNFTLPSKWSHRRDLRRSGVKENDYDSNNSTLSQMRQLIIISKFDNKNLNPHKLTPKIQTTNHIQHIAAIICTTYRVPTQPLWYNITADKVRMADRNTTESPNLSRMS